MSKTKQQPVIKKALNRDWDKLADVVKLHYNIVPGESSTIVISGVMEEVYHSPVAKLFLLPGRIFGALVPYKGKNISTEVRNWTSIENTSAMFWRRTLNFPDKKPVIFRSRMEHIKDNEIIEYVRYGMGLRMKMSVKDTALVFKSIGYVWKIGSIKIPIPTWVILGNAEIIEKAVSDDAFFIDFTMVHPLFGRTFSYSGHFSIVEKDRGHGRP